MLTPAVTTPNLVWKSHFDGDLSSAAIRAIKETILHPANAGSMRGGGKTNANHNLQDPHLWPELGDLMYWLRFEAGKVWEEWDLQPLPLEVQNSWTNVTINGGFVAEHDHSPSHMSIAVYLDKPEGSGNIEFRNPLHSSWTYMPRSHRDLSKQDFYQEVGAITGDVLFFPGWLSHRVQPNVTDKNRVVMSLNIIGVKYARN